MSFKSYDGKTDIRDDGTAKGWFANTGIPMSAEKGNDNSPNPKADTSAPKDPPKK